MQTLNEAAIKTSIRLNALEAKTLVEIVAPCAASYEGFTILAGVAMQWCNASKVLEFCATDTSRLTHYKMEKAWLDTPSFKTILPAAELSKVKLGKNAELVIAIDSTAAISYQKANVIGACTFNNEKLLPLIQGEYPRYHELFPVEYKNAGTIDVNETLKDYCKAAKIISPRTNVISLHFASGDQHLMVTMSNGTGKFSDPEASTHSLDVVAPLQISLNANYLAHALKLAGKPRGKNKFAPMFIKTNGGQKPVIFESLDFKSDLRMLIMPVQSR